MIALKRLNIFLPLLALILSSCDTIEKVEPDQGEVAENIKAIHRVQKRKLALLIGNSDYKRITNLEGTPIRDTQVMSSELENLGYKVERHTDLNSYRLREVVGDFTEMLTHGDDVFFHYAGHGIEVAGDSMILGVDFNARDVLDAKIQGFSVSSIINSISRAHHSVVVIDACRDNPFSRRMRNTRGAQRVNLSFPLRPNIERGGVYVVFSTLKGEQAKNGRDLSPFMSAFQSAVHEHGFDEVRELFNYHVQRLLINKGQELVTRTFGVWSYHSLKDANKSCPSRCLPTCNPVCIQALSLKNGNRVKYNKVNINRDHEASPMTKIVNNDHPFSHHHESHNVSQASIKDIFSGLINNKVDADILILNANGSRSTEDQLGSYLKMVSDLNSKINSESGRLSITSEYSWKSKFNHDVTRVIYVEDRYRSLAQAIEHILPGEQLVEPYEGSIFVGLDKRSIVIFLGRDLILDTAPEGELLYRDRRIVFKSFNGDAEATIKEANITNARSGGVTSILRSNDQVKSFAKRLEKYLSDTGVYDPSVKSRGRKMPKIKVGMGYKNKRAFLAVFINGRGPRILNIKTELNLPKVNEDIFRMND